MFPGILPSLVRVAATGSQTPAEKAANSERNGDRTSQEKEPGVDI
jgi:hypothetical protein